MEPTSTLTVEVNKTVSQCVQYCCASARSGERFGEKEATEIRTRRRQLCKEALVASCVVCKRFAMFAMTTLRMMLIGKCRSSRAVAKLLGIVV
jgi:hypothetical protein